MPMLMHVTGLSSAHMTAVLSQKLELARVTQQPTSSHSHPTRHASIMLPHETHRTAPPLTLCSAMATHGTTKAAWTPVDTEPKGDLARCTPLSITQCCRCEKAHYRVYWALGPFFLPMPTTAQRNHTR
jgi:hypothetical protein